MARFVACALAGTVLLVCDEVYYINVDDIDIVRKHIIHIRKLPKSEDMHLARKYKGLHDVSRDDLITYEAVELTTAIAEAARMYRFENGPHEFEAEILGINIGSVAKVSIPGEPFTDIGVRIKELGGWDIILPCALSNGSMGYFPNAAAYEEGGYESRSSSYARNVSDVIVEGCADVLKMLKK